MKMQELRQLTPKKLWESLKEARRSLAVTRFHCKTEQQKDIAAIRKQRTTVARILTLLKSQKTQ